MSEPLKESENIKYEVVTPNDAHVGDAVIRKTGMFSEFTLNDIARDLELYHRQLEDIEGKKKLDEAVMQNILNTNPEIGEISEELRQVIFIYTRAFSSVKELNKIIDANKAEAKILRGEIMTIAIQTGLGMQIAEEQNAKAEENEEAPNE